MEKTRIRAHRFLGRLLLAAAVALISTPAGASVAFATTTCPSAGTTLTDCSFETPAMAVGSWGSFVYRPTGTAWTFNGDSGVTANGSGFTGGQQAPDGTQVAFVQATGRFSQAIQGFVDGTPYTLSFSAARRANAGSAQDLEVLLDNVVLGKLLVMNTAYTRFAVSFTTTNGSHVLAFAGLNTAGGDNTAFVDAVQLSTAALPADCSDAAGTSLSQCGFETPSLGTGSNSYTYADFLGSAWTFNGLSGLAGNGSAFTGSQSAPEGTQVAFLQKTGDFAQAVTGFSDDTDYVLTFSAAQRANFGGVQDFQVLLDGAPLATFTPPGTSYTVFSVPFTTSSGMHVLGFAGLDSRGGDNTAFIDAIRLNGTAHPKPAPKPQATTLYFMGDTQFNAGEQGRLWAKLLDPNGNPIVGRTINFNLGQTQSCSAATDSSGTATCYVNPVVQPAGTVGVWVNFDGDTAYLPSAASWNVEVRHRTALTYTGAVASDFGDAFTASALLTDVSYSSPSRLAGLPVTMNLGGTSCTATTGSNGVASCSLSPAVPAGSYTVTAAFGARYGFLGSTASARFQVSAEETVLRYTGSSTAVSGTVQLSGVLSDDESRPVAGRAITFTLGSLSCSAVTNTSGAAACTVATGSLALGPTALSAAFGGDGYYRPAQTTAQVLLYAFPDHGVFVVGDKTNPNSVDFFDSDWWKANSLSGGPAPASFKGYADGYSALAAGGTWTASPGGSDKAPSDVPSYMGVVIASRATADPSGTITGDIQRIAIVHVDHYVRTVGQSGAGSIVS